VNFLPTMVSVEMAERANKAVVSILAKATGENMHLLLENQEMDERLVRDPRFARMVLEHSGHTIGELKEQHHRSLVEAASAERRLQRELTRVKQQNEVQKTKTKDLMGELEAVSQTNLLRHVRKWELEAKKMKRHFDLFNPT